MFSIDITVRKKPYKVFLELHDDYMYIEFKYCNYKFKITEECNTKSLETDDCELNYNILVPILQSILKREIYNYNHKRYMIKKVKESYGNDNEYKFLEEE